MIKTCIASTDYSTLKKMYSCFEIAVQSRDII